MHNIAGIAALASILYVGKRKVVDRGPHSIPLVALGTGLLWFGWYGFNAGSEFRVDSITAVAFINTDIAASFAAIAWLLVDWRVSKKPKFLGLLTGAVAGLATITPAAGYVSPATAAIIGLAAGVVCYYACALKNKLQWDDALDVWGVHGVGGFLGIVLLGVFASTAWNPAANGGVDGLLAGDSSFFMKQLAAGALLVRLGVCLHPGNVVAHQPHHSRASRRRARRTRPRRGDPRRDGLHRRIIAAIAAARQILRPT